MKTGVTAYPLQWPDGWKRTPDHKRERGGFSVSMVRARDGLMAEVARLGGKHVVLSSNLELRLDGLPLASQRKIDDHGIAVYFEYKARPMCFACDRYTRFEANMRAVELTIAALRGIERWGASDMLDRAFTGFAALPAPSASSWAEVIGVSPDASNEVVRDAYRRERARCHPDRGGDADVFLKLRKAYEAFCAERGATT